MPPAHLPPLAGLRLGAARTGMRAPASRRQRVDPATAATEPPPLSLAGLPRDVIEVMVTQAARGARDAEDPAGAICAWMKSFCKAAKVQDLKCDDHWYKLALQAFGVHPNAPRPAQMWYNWRTLFANACDNLHGPNALPFVQSRGFPPGFGWNASQRELDWELVGLFEARMRWRMIDNPGMTFDEARDLEKASWEALGDPNDPRRQQIPGNIDALAVLLVLKGAEPWADKKYRALDSEIDTTLTRMYRGEIDADEALRLIRDALDRGALVSSSGWRYDHITNMPMSIEDTLGNAVIVNAGNAILNLLLDRGAKVQFSTYHTHSFTFLIDASTEPGWSADRVTTERLIEAARTIIRTVVLRHDAGKLGNYRRGVVSAMRTAPAPPADWLTAAWKRLFDVTQWMDPRELEEHLPQMADYDPAAWPDP